VPASSEGLLSVFDLFVHDAVVEVAEAHPSVELLREAGFFLLPRQDLFLLSLLLLFFGFKRIEPLLADVIDTRQRALDLTARVLLHILHDFLSLVECLLCTVSDHAGPVGGLALSLEHVLLPLLHLSNSGLKHLFVLDIKLVFRVATLGSRRVGPYSFTTQKWHVRSS